jgi:hypothetical protein
MEVTTLIKNWTETAKSAYEYCISGSITLMGQSRVWKRSAGGMVAPAVTTIGERDNKSQPR